MQGLRTVSPLGTVFSINFWRIYFNLNEGLNYKVGFESRDLTRDVRNTKDEEEDSSRPPTDLQTRRAPV